MVEEILYGMNIEQLEVMHFAVIRLSPDLKNKCIGFARMKGPNEIC